VRRLAAFPSGIRLGSKRFTLSDFELGKLLTAAITDQARKHRRRSPVELENLEKQRRTG
jgi:hypothetical protein